MLADASPPRRFALSYPCVASNRQTQRPISPFSCLIRTFHNWRTRHNKQTGDNCTNNIGLLLPLFPCIPTHRQCTYPAGPLSHREVAFAAVNVSLVRCGVIVARALSFCPQLAPAGGVFGFHTRTVHYSGLDSMEGWNSGKRRRTLRLSFTWESGDENGGGRDDSDNGVLSIPTFFTEMLFRHERWGRPKLLGFGKGEAGKWEREWKREDLLTVLRQTHTKNVARLNSFECWIFSHNGTDCTAENAMELRKGPNYCSGEWWSFFYMYTNEVKRFPFITCGSSTWDSFSFINEIDGSVALCAERLPFRASKTHIIVAKRTKGRKIDASRHFSSTSYRHCNIHPFIHPHGSTQLSLYSPFTSTCSHCTIICDPDCIFCSFYFPYCTSSFTIIHSSRFLKTYTFPNTLRKFLFLFQMWLFSSLLPSPIFLSTN